MAVVDQMFLRSIPISEFLQKAFMKPEQCPKFTEFVNRFNRVLKKISFPSWECSPRVDFCFFVFHMKLISFIFFFSGLCGFPLSFCNTKQVNNAQIFFLTWSMLRKNVKSFETLMLVMLWLEVSHIRQFHA